MKKNRKRYQRRLDVLSLVALLVFGAVVAGVACGFVGIKNGHVDHSDLRRNLEDEIRVLEKEVETVELRIARGWDRRSLDSALARLGSDLVPIESSEQLAGLPAEVPAALAQRAGADSAEYNYADFLPPGG